MEKLFGTDGIRGVANVYPVTSEMAVHIGRTTASMLRKDEERPVIVIGKDTRASGDMLEHALASGICSAGADAYLAGIIPTPGVAFLMKSTGADAGMMISASHNPFYDNGIKLFQADGFKLSDEKEAQIERLLLKEQENPEGEAAEVVGEIGRVHQMPDASGRYSTFLKGSLKDPHPFKGVKLVLDCSNGATYGVGPDIFADLGAEISSIFIDPNGKNINDNCGSQHPETLQRAVLENEADMGLALDGDGDRLIAVDEKGCVVSGDQILLICAKWMKEKGMLANNRVVSTVMSNVGFKIALTGLGIAHDVADVGDRYVLEKMIQTGSVLGGEDSGHIIFLDRHTTGDGLFSALRLISAVQTESRPLSELSRMMECFPQVLINISVSAKPDIDTIPDLSEAIQRVETDLGEKGRVLVRYSGTQPMCRVMVEGPTLEETRRHCQYLADIIDQKLGIK